MGTSRATLKTKLRNCAEPAPVPQDLTVTVSGDIVVQGLHIDPSTGFLLVEVANGGSVVVVTGKTPAPSQQDVLGTLTVAFTLATPNDGDTYHMYLLGACARKAFVGTLTIDVP